MKKQFFALIVPALTAAALAACGGSAAPEGASTAAPTAAANAGAGDAFAGLLGTTAAPAAAAESQEAPVTETTAPASAESAAPETSPAETAAPAAAETSAAKAAETSAPAGSAAPETTAPESAAAETSPASHENVMPHDGGGKPAEDVLESDAAALLDAAAAASVKPIVLVSDDVQDFCMTQDGDNYNIYGEYSVPALTVSSVSAEQYPLLTKALDRFTGEQFKSRDTIRENLEKTHAELGAAADSYKLEDKTTVICGRSDSAIVSFVLENNLYLGGAHPYVERTSVNLDPATGNEIALDSIVLDKDALRKKILEKLSTIEYVSEQQLEDRLKEVPPAEEAWSLDNSGLHFYYDDYAFGSYAVGLRDIVIPYGELKGILAPQYTVLPAARIERLPKEGRTIDDLFGEGAFANVAITYQTHPSEWDPEVLMYDGFTVTVLDAPLTVDHIGSDGEMPLDIYEMDPELFRTSDGRYYLYMYCSGAEEGDSLEIVSLNDPAKGLSWAGRLPGCNHGYESVPYARFGVEPLEEGFPVHYLDILESDADRFRLFERTDMFGTGSIYRTYRVGKDGMPESGDEIYYCPVHQGSSVPVSRTELMLEGVDPATGQPNGKRVRVPAGTSFTKIRTDNETFVDCFIGGDLSNQVRLRIKTDEWPTTVNGIPEEDAFDGVLYAG